MTKRLADTTETQTMIEWLLNDKPATGLSYLRPVSRLIVPHRVESVDYVGISKRCRVWIGVGVRGAQVRIALWPRKRGCARVVIERISPLNRREVPKTVEQRAAAIREEYRMSREREESDVAEAVKSGRAVDFGHTPSGLRWVCYRKRETDLEFAARVEVMRARFGEAVETQTARGYWRCPTCCTPAPADQLGKVCTCCGLPR